MMNKNAFSAPFPPTNVNTLLNHQLPIPVARGMLFILIDLRLVIFETVPQALSSLRSTDRLGRPAAGKCSPH